MYNPTDVVRHLIAGERILEKMLALYHEDIPGSGGLRIFKYNVDYSGAYDVGLP